MNEKERQAIKILKDMNDGYTFQLCRTCIADNKYNEKKGICESTSCEYLNSINIVLSLIDRLQKEVEEKTIIIMAGAEKVKKLEQENEELKEYKKITELTKISCCTAQNCEALSNSIRDSLENEELKKELDRIQKENEELTKTRFLVNITGDRIEITNGIGKEKQMEDKKVGTIVIDGGETPTISSTVEIADLQKINAELKKENEEYRQYINRLDDLNAQDFYFKHEAILKQDIKDKINDLEIGKAYVDTTRYNDFAIAILKELLGE